MPTFLSQVFLVCINIPSTAFLVVFLSFTPQSLAYIYIICFYLCDYINSVSISTFEYVISIVLRFFYFECLMMQNIDYVEITNHVYEKGGKNETPEFHMIFIFIERREGEDLFPVLWFHSYEHLSRRKQKKKSTNPTRTAFLSFRMPS